MSFFNELKRRNVFRVAIGYVISSWLLMQVADLVLDNIGSPDWVIQTIMLVIALGFPVVVFFSWAFEVTPEGIKRESEIDRSQSITHVTSRKLDYSILAVLILALGYFVWETRFQSIPDGVTAGPVQSSAAVESTPEQEPAIGKSIAVLPFENFSGDVSDQYFADGLADTLLHKLAQITDLKVIARNSSFQFKGTNKDVREIGEILNVATVLEGSVQRSGDQVRITAQLINTADGVHIWSQSFDDSMDNIFALQDSVASDIVSQLEINLSKEEQARLLRNGTDNREAYDLVMRSINSERDMDSMVDSDIETWPPIQMLLKAVELDPEYAEAWVNLSQEYDYFAFMTDSAEDFDRYVGQARAAAEKALTLEPNMSNAHMAMGWVEHRSRESLKAASHFRRALELNPNNDGALSGLGLQIARSDPKEALRLFTRSHEIDPSSLTTYRQKKYALLSLGRTEEAIHELELAVQAAPGDGLSYSDLSGLLIESQGRPDEAARQLSRLLQITPRSFDGVVAMVDAWVAATDDSRATAWIEQLMMGRSDSDDAKLENTKVLMSAARYQEALQQLAEVNENQKNGWQIVSLNLLANLGLKETEKAIEYAVQFRSILNDLKVRGAPRPSSEVILTIMEILIHEQQDPDFKPAEILSRLTSVTSMPMLKSAYYLQAGIQVRLGDTNGAMTHLEQALSKPDGGVFNVDQLGFSVEQSLLLNPLRGQAAFENWMQRYRARRDTMLQRMIEMERNGEILSAETLARMTSQ